MHVTPAHQRGKMPGEQSADQRGDVPPVRIGVGQYAYAVVTQIAQVRVARLYPQRQGDVMHLLGRVEVRRIHFPGVQDLAAQGQNGLKFAAPRLAGRAPG